MHVANSKTVCIVGGLELSIPTSQINVHLINTETGLITRPTLNKVSVSKEQKSASHTTLLAQAVGSFDLYIESKKSVAAKISKRKEAERAGADAQESS